MLKLGQYRRHNHHQIFGLILHHTYSRRRAGARRARQRSGLSYDLKSPLLRTPICRCEIAVTRWERNDGTSAPLAACDHSPVFHLFRRPPPSLALGRSLVIDPTTRGLARGPGARFLCVQDSNQIPA